MEEEEEEEEEEGGGRSGGNEGCTEGKEVNEGRNDFRGTIIFKNRFILNPQ